MKFWFIIAAELLIGALVMWWQIKRPRGPAYPKSPGVIGGGGGET